MLKMSVKYERKRWGDNCYEILGVISDYKSPRFYASFDEANEASIELVQKLEDCFGLGFYAMTEEQISRNVKVLTFTDYNWYEANVTIIIEEVEG